MLFYAMMHHNFRTLLFKILDSPVPGIVRPGINPTLFLALETKMMCKEEFQMICPPDLKLL